MKIAKSLWPNPPGGRRTYSTGMARFITQARMEDRLAGESIYSYARCNPTKYVDPSGKEPVRFDEKINKMLRRLLKRCGVPQGPPGPRDRETLAAVMTCMAYAEGDNTPTFTNTKALNGTAYGLFQLSSWQFDDCTSDPDCKGKMLDAECNAQAAINLFLSTCNDVLTNDYEPGGGGFQEVPRDPMSAFRGPWGCTRGEGDKFKNCLAFLGITEDDIRGVPCPPKTKQCPGCKTPHPVKYR